MLKGSAISLGSLSLFATAFMGMAAAQVAPQKNVNMSGTWDVTIVTRSITDGKQLPPVSETWTIQQTGTTIKGTAKTDSGEMPLTGTMSAQTIRGDIVDGAKHRGIFASVDGDQLYGTITLEGAIVCDETGACVVEGQYGAGKVAFLLGKRTSAPPRPATAAGTGTKAAPTKKQ